ncbi:hypothetical protein ACIG53_16210 [Streptomyces bauhiniae]
MFEAKHEGRQTACLLGTAGGAWPGGAAPEDERLLWSVVRALA